MPELTQYQQECIQAEKAINDIGRAIALHMPEGWTAIPSDNGDEYTRLARFKLLHNSGMVIALCADEYGTKGKIHAYDAAWPTYTRWDDHNRQPQKETIHAGDCYVENVPQNVSGIYFAATKTPQQMAGDITRRLLPEYARVYALARERAERYQRDADATRRGWEVICRMIGANADSKYAGFYIAELGRVELQKGGTDGKAAIKFEVSPQCLGRLIDVFGGLRSRD